MLNCIGSTIFCFMPEPRKKNLYTNSNTQPFLNEEERTETEKVKTDSKISDFIEIIFKFNPTRN